MNQDNTPSGPERSVDQKVYFVINIHDELPDKSGWYNCYQGDEFLGQDYFTDGRFSHKPVTHWLKAGFLAASPKDGDLTIEDYKEAFEDHKRLVRELDKIINGDNAAKQASLCDIVKQCENIFKKDTSGMQWISGHKKELLPPDDSHEDFQKLYVCRFKGDDPRSGWVDIELYAAYVMREIDYSDYWEWLDESAPLLSTRKINYEQKYKEANQFICDIAKLLGEDNLGLDDITWGIDDFENAIKNYSNQQGDNL